MHQVVDNKMPLSTKFKGVGFQLFLYAAICLDFNSQPFKKGNNRNSHDLPSILNSRLAVHSSKNKSNRSWAKKRGAGEVPFLQLQLDGTTCFQ